MKFIKENKAMIIIGVICLFLLVLVFTTVYSMFNPSNSKDVYGSRLDGEVTISDNELEKVKTEISSSSIVNSVTINKNIRIIKLIISVKENTKLEDSYKLGDIILNNFSKEVLSYYDIEVYVTSNTENYPIIGYHSTIADSFTWTINRGEVSE